jgi:predicted nucleotidyltransferase
MRAKDFVNDTVTYHDTLCPVAWQGTDMLPEVREKLLQIAEFFVGYLEVTDFRVLDIVLTGSLANYNWTKFSDFDIHVVTDYADLNADNVVEAFYQAKKKIWNDEHDIKIKGHEAELYVENINDPPVAQGMFSLLNNKWINQPAHEPPALNNGAVYHKVKGLVVDIKHAIRDADDPFDMKRLITKLRNMRKAGLAAGGEFSVENLAFKVLRNLGYLDKIQKEFLRQQDHLLSLVELSEDLVEQNDMKSLLHKFMPVAMKYLQLKDLPRVVLKSKIQSADGQSSFGQYSEQDQCVYLAASQRHPVDVLRTLAHELVHYKQHLEDKMYDGAGETGSPIENEANEVAGIIMRHFNKKYPKAIEAIAIK